jgi:hypothetical protein
MKPEGRKRYGRVSLSNGPLLPPFAVSDKAGLAVSLIQGQLPVAAPFGNTWLNVLSALADKRGIDPPAGLTSALGDVSDLVAPELQADLVEALRPRNPALNGNSALAPVEVVLALAHGLAGAAMRGISPAVDVVLRWASTGAELLIGGEVVFAIGDRVGPDDRELTFVHASADATKVSSGHRSLLVRIGDASINLPEDLFAAVIVVDDRPSRGGGLPDLWEAAIAQVVDVVADAPNLRMVFAVGDEKHARQTLTRLKNAAAWEEPETSDDLAFKLGLGTAPIRAAGGRLADGLRLVESLDDIVTELLNHEKEAPALVGRASVEGRRVGDRPLTRTFSPERYRLRREDGCRVDTAFLAFPIALELVRHSDEPDVRDQSGRGYRELVDFRIALSNPSRDPIPAFYLREKSLLDAYYEDQFINPDGLFRSALEENDQLPRVIQHVADTIATGGVSSRRGILIVPHVPQTNQDLTPLGLVSVRLVPRVYDDGAIELRGSFSWRTVEALVGLPYSLYGSIRFLADLTEMVRANLPAPLDRSLRAGSLSYIAHSLHLFTDRYALAIARRVIAEETE